MKEDESHFFDETSDLAGDLQDFRFRPGQVEMASFVSNAIRRSRHAIIEAGTGTGKTFAYLMPVLRSKKKVIISTGTKNLQDQLFSKDIPLANKQFGVKVAILKGRANYLCRDRLFKNIKMIGQEHAATVLQALSEVQDWATRTRTGDLTELLDPSEMNPVVPMVTSTTDNCLGQDCDYYDSCPVYIARRRAQEADLVVVNHHLLLADLGLKELDVAQLLPSAEVVVVDEAHQLPDIARQFFGERFSSRQLRELSGDTKREQLLVSNDDPGLIECCHMLELATGRLTQSFALAVGELERKLDDSSVQEVIEEIDLLLSDLVRFLKLAAERSVGLEHCYTRVLSLVDVFATMTSIGGNEAHAHWIEMMGSHPRYSGFVIQRAPVQVSEELAPIIEKSSQSWLFVSATLTVNKSFEHYKSAIGLKNIDECRLESPFDFASQVLSFVPLGLPAAGTDQHTQALLTEVLPLVRQHSGRSFMLFTSHRALQLASRLLQHEHDLTFLTQGSMPKKALLQKFTQLPRCILLATQSFWEGVDVRGADLRLLVIDKLPFSSPDNAIFRAQSKAVEEQGDNAFRTLALPEAAITLKQGFGRLIRQETDSGLFVLGDSRIIEKNYGGVLRASLPEMQWTSSPDEAQRFLEKIDNASTQ
ncbi:MAG: ATP-dependent DNA helicase [Pseudomonadales bacterium]